MEYFYRWEDLESIQVGRSYSSGEGPLIKGERMQIALVRKAKGTGARPHHHPNEQFHYVVKGTLKAMVDGQEEMVTAGGVIHIPPNVVHATVATPEEDVIFFTVKDTSWGIVGIAADGQDSGAHYEPGFEPESKVKKDK